jgi:hypothetical protein
MAIAKPIKNQIKNLRSSFSIVDCLMHSLYGVAPSEFSISDERLSFNNSLTFSGLLKRKLYTCAFKTTAFHDQVYIY